MINQWIDSRYELIRELMRSEEGIWYIANDTALKREIIILVTELNEYELLLKTQREMTNISNTSSDAYLQILNAGRYEDNSYIIFRCHSGMPLFQYVEQHAVSLQTVLQWIYRVGEILLDAQRAGLPDYVVSFENLWITHNEEILVMNYWKQARSSRTGVIGLMQLLYQCCTLHALAPRQSDIFEGRMQSALKNEDPLRRQAVMTLVNRTFENEPSLNSYVAMLKEILDQPFVPLAVTKAGRASEPQVTAKPVLTMDTMMFTSDTAQELKAKREQERAAAGTSNLTTAANGDNIDDLMSVPTPSGRSRAVREENEQSPTRKFSRKMKVIVVTASCVVFFGVIGTAILWANSLTDNKSTDSQTEWVQPMKEQSSGAEEINTIDKVESVDQNESSKQNSSKAEEQGNSTDRLQENPLQEPEKELVTIPSDSNTSVGGEVGSEDQNSQNQEQQTEGTMSNTSGPTTADGNTETENNATPEGDATVVPGIVPNLLGLTQEEAEKQALAVGLKYSFMKENVEGTEEGFVFKQEPAPGTEFKKGDRVTFYVARGN